jgi:hypothetical protein
MDDNSSYRLIFYLDTKNEMYHYSLKEHSKMSKIAKFGFGSKVVHIFRAY